jgi:hypothetical protein
MLDAEGEEIPLGVAAGIPPKPLPDPWEPFHDDEQCGQIHHP